MTIKKIAGFGIGLLIVGAIIYVNYPKGGARVTFALSEKSEVKQNISLSLDSKPNKVFSLPKTLRLKPGTYRYQAWGRSVISTSGEFSVTGEDLTVPLVMMKGTGTEEGGFTSTGTRLLHETSEYTIEKITKSDATSEIIITVSHRFASPEDTSLYQEESESAISAAESWLKDNVDQSIPRTYVNR